MTDPLRNDGEQDAAPPWLDEAEPHAPERSQAQVRGVLKHLAGSSAHVLDLGCGAGRLLRPLVEAGHAVVGMDLGAEVLKELPGDPDASLIPPHPVHGDFLKGDWPSHPDRAGAPFDAVLLLGNTFMTIAELDDAVALVRRVRERLAPHGRFILDDLPQDLWPELTEGNWQSGISEDETSQLIWAADDQVFTIRQNERVDPEAWSLRPQDRRFRLWTMSGLTMLARLTGLSDPRHDAAHGLILFSCADRPD